MEKQKQPLTQISAAPQPEAPRGVWAYPGVNRHGEPFVQVRRGENGQVLFGLSADAARDFARNLFACAEAAESDLVVYRWLKERCKADDQKAAAIIQDFRRMRQPEHAGEEHGPALESVTAKVAP